jgi:DNA repair protein RecO (recombination protein O)
MDKPRFLKTEAIVLKHYPLGEADRVVTLLTPGSGKVRAVAKGVRRVKSRLGGHLEPLTRTRVMLAQGRSLDTISSAETIASNLPLRKDLWRTTCGIYLAELVERFATEEQANLPLYGLLCAGLDALGRAADLDPVLRYLELRVLITTGFRPELGQCVQCGAAIQPGAHFFSAQAGGALCPACRRNDPLARPLSLNALKVLRLYAASPLETACRVRLDRDLAVELEHLLRQYIMHVLEYGLKSVEFLDLLQRERTFAAPASRPVAQGGTGVQKGTDRQPG